MDAVEGILVGVAFGLVTWHPWTAVKVMGLVGIIHFLRIYYARY